MRTSAGRDWQASVMGATSGTGIGTGAFAPANYMALTANATAPADGDTTLTAEIATASGGLIRKQCTYARTSGASSWTETAVFTANANDVLPVTIAKIGIFTAAAGGTMAFETLLSNTVTLSAVNDQVTITDTISQ